MLALITYRLVTAALFGLSLLGLVAGHAWEWLPWAGLGVLGSVLLIGHQLNKDLDPDGSLPDKAVVIGIVVTRFLTGVPAAVGGPLIYRAWFQPDATPEMLSAAAFVAGLSGLLLPDLIRAVLERRSKSL